MLAWTVRSWRITGSGGGRSLWPQQPKIYPTLSEPACAKTPIPQMFQNVSVYGRKLASLALDDHALMGEVFDEKALVLVLREDQHVRKGADPWPKWPKLTRATFLPRVHRFATANSSPRSTTSWLSPSWW